MLNRNFTGNDSSFISITDSNNSRLDLTQNIYLQTEDQIFNQRPQNNFGDDYEFEMLNDNLNIFKLPEASANKLLVKNGSVKITQNNNSQYNGIPLQGGNERNINYSRYPMVNFF